MFLARVTGSVVATQKVASMTGHKLLTVEPLRAHRNGSATGGAWGVFKDVNAAVEAATAAQQEFARRGLEDRRKAVACIRKICVEQAGPLGREELEETKIGRLDHKVEKLVVAGE